MKLDAAVEAGKITQESHPSRVRELKLQQVEFATRKGESHPSRVRELKQAYEIGDAKWTRRTPPGCVN